MADTGEMHRECKARKDRNRHILQEYVKLAEDIRHTPEYKALYDKRKQTIERIFAYAKEKYGMRYTPYRGLTQVTNWVRLKFAAMNLKKLATWKWNASLPDFIIIYLFRQFHRRNPRFAFA